jgi:hypothetical protein
MVSIVTKTTAKGTREVCLNIVVVVSLMFVVIAPLRVLVPQILVAPSRLGLLGMVSSLPWIISVLVSSFIFGIIQLMGQVGHIQLVIFSCSKFWYC